MNDSPREAMHRRRMRRMLLLGSAILGLTSLFWGGFFAWRGYWTTASLDVVSVVLAATVARLTLDGHLRAASRLLVAALYVVLCIVALVFDIPTPQVSRSMHQFLLALGVVSCLLTRDEPAWLRHGIPLVCFATYTVFACTPLGWETTLALPDSIRWVGNWINHAVALVTVYAVLYVIQNEVADRQGLEGELEGAMLRGELLLHYQPQVDRDDRIVGAEALVRWRHPVRGMVSPGEFIPLAEKSGLMPAVGDWVLRTACAQLARWPRQPGTAGLRLAVNVSASQFAQPDFVARVLACVEQHGIDASQLKLELTESMLAHDVEDIIAKMTALKARGIGFSLDDFGTGFSSLSYLRRLPLDQLKIDQSFVRSMLNSPKEAAIAQALVSLARELGLGVIAEGVETVEERDALRAMGCGTYQGFLFSRPVPAAEFDALMSRSAPEALVPAL
jgi:EAL domain-containing protein (putative c-di-GMP-specific phosphodiesterase class I)